MNTYVENSAFILRAGCTALCGEPDYSIRCKIIQLNVTNGTRMVERMRTKLLAPSFSARLLPHDAWSSAKVIIILFLSPAAGIMTSTTCAADGHAAASSSGYQ